MGQIVKWVEHHREGLETAVTSEREFVAFLKIRVSNYYIKLVIF